jgi:transcriptional regulator with XRE-family HTH domain
MTAPVFDNNLAKARLAAGFQTAAALAATVGIEPAWYELIESGRVLPEPGEIDALAAALGVKRRELYDEAYTDMIGSQQVRTPLQELAAMYAMQTDTAHLFVSPAELAWLERAARPDRRAEIFVNLSCSVQLVPNLLLDAVSVLDALGVEYVSAAGPSTCCGKPYRKAGHVAAGERMNAKHVEQAAGWGATRHVNWCTSCQATYTAAAARRSILDQGTPALREVLFATFLHERLSELGPRVPWRAEVPARVLVQGDRTNSAVHAEATASITRILEMVPGVTVVGDIPELPDAPRTGDGRPASAGDVLAARDRLASAVRALGADTVSCQHQYSHKAWSYFASDGMAVRHAVSIVAEALGCAHPDRFQMAIRLGDPERVIAQTRPVWSSWGMDPARALVVARELFDPIYADPQLACACGGDGCRERLIPLEGIGHRAG